MSPIRTPWLTAPAAKVSQFRNLLSSNGPALHPCGDSDELHLHDLGFFVLEMIVNGFNEAIGELLHFFLNIA